MTKLTMTKTKLTMTKTKLTMTKHMNVTTLEQLIAMAPSIATQSPHPDVSDRYCHIKTVDLVAPMLEAGWHAVRARQAPVLSQARKGFQRHQVFFRREEDLELKSKNDDVFELSIINSHDRTTAWQFNAGIFRVVCTNGLIVSKGLFMGQRLKHINIQPKEVTLAAIQATRSVAVVMEHRELMRGRALADHERLTFAERALSIKYEDVSLAPVGARVLLEARREEDRDVDLWTTFNVVQENLVRGLQRDESRVDAFGRKFGPSLPINKLDRQVKVNQELWEAAEELLIAKN